MHICTREHTHNTTNHHLYRVSIHLGCKQAHTQIYTGTHTHTHEQICASTHTHTYKSTHAHTHTTRAHVHACTHKRTHTFYASKHVINAYTRTWINQHPQIPWQQASGIQQQLRIEWAYTALFHVQWEKAHALDPHLKFHLQQKHHLVGTAAINLLCLCVNIFLTQGIMRKILSTLPLLKVVVWYLWMWNNCVTLSYVIRHKLMNLLSARQWLCA